MIVRAVLKLFVLPKNIKIGKKIKNYAKMFI